MSSLNVFVLFSLGFFSYGISEDIIDEGIMETDEMVGVSPNKKEVLSSSEALDDSLNKTNSPRQGAGNLDELDNNTTKKIVNPPNPDAKLDKLIAKLSDILDKVDVALRDFPKYAAEFEKFARQVSKNLDAMASAMKKAYPKVAREMRDLSETFEDILADAKKWNIKILKTLNSASHSIDLFFDKDLSWLLKESRRYLKNWDSSITKIVHAIDEKGLKVVDGLIYAISNLGRALDNFVSVLLTMRILLALWIGISVAIFVWLVLVIYDKLESIKLVKYAADDPENRKATFLKLFGKKSSNMGTMNSQSTTVAGVKNWKPMGRLMKSDVEFTKMDEVALDIDKTSSASYEYSKDKDRVTDSEALTKMDEVALEIEKTSSASYEYSKDKDHDVEESKKFETGGDELVKKKDDDISDDIPNTKRDSAKAKEKEKGQFRAVSYQEAKKKPEKRITRSVG